jgi:hypothetical protein
MFELPEDISMKAYLIAEAPLAGPFSILSATTFFKPI